MKKLLVLWIALVLAANAHAFLPQSGLWAINDENKGTPGRGFQVEVQGSTLALTFFGYAADGRDTFYIASGTLANNTLTAPLLAFSGGTPFGGSYRPAVSAGSPGSVTLTFTTGGDGFITLPGESTKAISRFSFGPADPNGLLGEWIFVNKINGVTTLDAPNFTVLDPKTADGSGVVRTADRSISCERQVTGELAGLVVCVKSNSLGQLTDSFLFDYVNNEGEGLATGPSGSANDPLRVFRLRRADGVSTGLVQ